MQPNPSYRASAHATEPKPGYIGRFAPSPTGPLHLGSLVAAVGSWLDARAHRGRWLLRIEDLDAPRVVPGCADQMLRTLEVFGLSWDGPVVYQSRRSDLYSAALAALERQNRLFACSCSRKELSNTGDTGYPGTCRGGVTRPGPSATRFRIADEETVCFEDRVQGACCYRLGPLGDPVIRRRDGLFAYQLAVVVDDADQGVSDVVRGSDLLQSTAWQISLQRALRYPGLRYAHLPLITEPSGEKLAKSRRSIPLDAHVAGVQLHIALSLLEHPPPSEISRENPRILLDWALREWNLDRVQRVREMVVPN